MAVAQISRICYLISWCWRASQGSSGGSKAPDPWRKTVRNAAPIPAAAVLLLLSAQQNALWGQRYSTRSMMSVQSNNEASIITPIVFWPSESPLCSATDTTITMTMYSPKLAKFSHQTTWRRKSIFIIASKIYNNINVHEDVQYWSQQTYGVPQQVNTIICIIYTGKPQSLKNKQLQLQE